MAHRKIHWIKALTVTLGAGVIFGTLTCVQTVADTVGTGLTITGTAGLYGNNSDSTVQVGAALDLLADFLRYIPR